MSLTSQEKKFADDYVFQYFHTSAVYSGMAVSAAEYAGYEVPVYESKAELFGKSLLAKKEISEYIDSEIKRFRNILSGQQRRNLWEHISSFKAGTPESGTASGDYGNIIIH
jgi:hypothetical protein